MWQIWENKGTQEDTIPFNKINNNAVLISSVIANGLSAIVNPNPNPNSPPLLFCTNLLLGWESTAENKQHFCH